MFLVRGTEAVNPTLVLYTNYWIASYPSCTTDHITHAEDLHMPAYRQDRAVLPQVVSSPNICSELQMPSGVSREMTGVRLTAWSFTAPELGRL